MRNTNRNSVHNPAFSYPRTVILLIFLLSLAGMTNAYAARYWCHDHTLFLVSQGKEKQIGTGPGALRDKLKNKYGYQLEKTFPNLRAMIQSGYQLKTGQVIFFGDAHSAYVESPSFLQHHYGETHGQVLHWTLDDFYQYKRTKNIVDNSPLGKVIYPMRGKPIQVWTNMAMVKKEAAQKFSLLEKEALAYLDYLKKPEVKKAALVAVTINEFMKKWWDDKKRLDELSSDADIMGRTCSGKVEGRFDVTGLEQVLADMKKSSDLILTAHDRTRSLADATCNAKDKDEAEKHLEQARKQVAQARQESGKLTTSRITLNGFHFSQLFSHYQEIQERHEELLRDLMNLSAITGVDFLTLATRQRSYFVPDDYDQLLISLGLVSEGDSRHSGALREKQADLVQTIKPFIKGKNWAALLNAKADALVQKTQNASLTVTRPIYEARMYMAVDKFPSMLVFESRLGKALQECKRLDPLYDKYREALSHYEPAKIFVERTFDQYARALDCRDKLDGKKQTPKARIQLTGKASKSKVDKGDRVSFLYTVSIGDHAPLANVQLQDGLCGNLVPRSGDSNADGKLDKNETWIYECTANIQNDTDNRIQVSAIDENGNPVAASLLLQVKVELTAEEKKEEAQKTKIRMLWIEPLRTTVKTGEKVTFSALLVFEDNSEKALSPGDVKWEPGPGNTFTSEEPGTYLVTAWYGDHRAIATVNVEEGESRTKWDKPISSSQDVGKKAMPAPADAFTWYALCEKNTGDVVYGEDINVARHRVLGGPFAGPRTAKQWIDQHYPSWRCPTSGVQGQWNVLCNKQNYTVAIGKTVDPTRYWIMQGGFVSEKDARTWLGQNCPTWTCSQGGACATGPRSGGDWAVVCSKEHGGIGLTKNPDPARSWIFASGLREEKDARLWVELRCPSWRCNRDGRCMTGIPRRTERKPLELPPEFDSPFSAGAEADADSMARQPETAPPARDKGYEFGRRLGEMLGRKLQDQLRQPPQPPASTGKPDTGVTWESSKKDCSAERKKFNDLANRMTEQAKKLNCEKGNHYSGCALDVVGPFFPYWPDRIFSDEACAKPGYIGCASGAFSSYVGCLDGCNGAWRSGGNRDLKGCGQKCFQQIDQAMKRCTAK